MNTDIWVETLINRWMAICQKIVNKHKGKIWVHSDARDGSTFYVSVPRL